MFVTAKFTLRKDRNIIGIVYWYAYSTSVVIYCLSNYILCHIFTRVSVYIYINFIKNNCLLIIRILF